MSAKALTCMLLMLAGCMAQESIPPVAQPRIAPWLYNCYLQSEIYERDNRLPMTPNMLIELIRKIEDSEGFNLNMQQLASTLLHRFKQDGIIREFTV